MSGEDDREVEADIQRMLAISHNRRDLGWSYFGLLGGGGHQIGAFPMTSAERARRSRAGEATPRHREVSP